MTSLRTLVAFARCMFFGGLIMAGMGLLAWGLYVLAGG